MQLDGLKEWTQIEAVWRAACTLPVCHRYKITLTFGQQVLLTKHLFAAPSASDESLELRAALGLLG